MTELEKQLAGAGKWLGSRLDTLDLDKRLSAVDKRLGSVADKVGLADRQRVLGLPLGGKRPEWGKIATYAAAAASVVIAGVRTLSGNGNDDTPDSASGDAPKGKDVPKAEKSGTAQTQEDDNTHEVKDRQEGGGAGEK
jgi:hypothetical protein